MSLIVPSAQKRANLLAWIAASAPWTLRIYGNDKTPANGDVVGNYTEISGGGYVAASLTAAAWTVTIATPAVMSYAAQTFLFTGPLGGAGTIYGYYITDASGALVLAERLAFPPFTPAIAGDAIIVTPRVQLDNIT